jgi:hypothetical protein
VDTIAPDDGLLLARHLVDFGLALVAWVVQAVIYPSFRWSDAETFPDWHARYTRAISWFVVPLMFGQAFLVIEDAVRSPNVASLSSATLVAAGFLLTFFLAVPAHRELSSGKASGPIQRLLRVNLVRAVAWTIVLGLGFR